MSVAINHKVLHHRVHLSNINSQIVPKNKENYKKKIRKYPRIEKFVKSLEKLWTIKIVQLKIQYNCTSLEIHLQ